MVDSTRGEIQFSSYGESEQWIGGSPPQKALEGRPYEV